jgi:ABC-type enterobactin transport system permease subunit
MAKWSIALAAAMLLTACSFERAHVAAEAQRSMIGMTKEQVLACMGPPAQQQTAGATEVWAYPSGGEDRTFGSATGVSSANGVYGSGYANAWGSSSAFGSSTSVHRYCVVNVVMSDGRVSAVHYSGRTGGLLTEGEQCAFAVQNCAQHSEALTVADHTLAAVLPLEETPAKRGAGQ